MQQYQSPKPLITAAFVLEGDNNYHSSTLPRSDQEWIQRLTCEKAFVCFREDLASKDSKEAWNTRIQTHNIFLQWGRYQSENEALQRINLGYAVVPTRSFSHNTGQLKHQWWHCQMGSVFYRICFVFRWTNRPELSISRNAFWLK